MWTMGFRNSEGYGLALEYMMLGRGDLDQNLVPAGRKSRHHYGASIASVRPVPGKIIDRHMQVTRPWRNIAGRRAEDRENPEIFGSIRNDGHPSIGKRLCNRLIDEKFRGRFVGDREERV